MKDINLIKVRKTLGKTGEKLSDEEILELMTKFDYLADGFLDMYERSIFKGKRVKDLIDQT